MENLMENLPMYITCFIFISIASYGIWNLWDVWLWGNKKFINGLITIPFICVNCGFIYFCGMDILQKITGEALPYFWE
jgi:hypothetical protein